MKYLRNNGIKSVRKQSRKQTVKLWFDQKHAVKVLNSKQAS